MSIATLILPILSNKNPFEHIGPPNCMEVLVLFFFCNVFAKRMRPLIIRKDAHLRMPVSTVHFFSACVCCRIMPSRTSLSKWKCH